MENMVNVKINGKELSTTASRKTVVKPAAITLADGTQAVIIEVGAKIADNSDTTGFSYQYIDVDGDNALDFTKDIVLVQVTGVAPEAWTKTTLADLNLVNTVEILLPTTAGTKDDSTLNSAQTGNTEGNKLAGEVIKAK